jgi:hypothetical protein
MSKKSSKNVEGQRRSSMIGGKLQMSQILEEEPSNFQMMTDRDDSLREDDESLASIPYP